MMDFIHRKVFLTKDLVPYDSDGDGVMDALILSATTKTLQIPLRQSFDDIGIYEVDDEESIEIIDIGGFMNDGVPGDGITQPTTPPSVSGNTWDGGGTVSEGTGEVEYCDVLGATNQQTLSTGIVNGINVYILTDRQGLQTIYGPNSAGDYPSFTVNPSLCVYSTPGDPGTSTGGGSSSSGGGNGGIKTLTKTANCNQSWSSYYSTALSHANNYCNTNYGTSTLASSYFSGVPQGDCNTPQGTSNTLVFPEVKLKSSTYNYCCCGSYTCGENNDQCCQWCKRYTFTFCFYCS